jgi:hypothetical protein
MLLVDSSRAEEGAQGLIGHRIVSMSAPSLGYLLLGDLYKNPISQPEIQSVAANWNDGVQMVFAGETDAAMVPSYIATLYPNLVAVNESREFTGRALSASPTVPAAVRTAVRRHAVRAGDARGLRGQRDPAARRVRLPSPARRRRAQARGPRPRGARGEEEDRLSERPLRERQKAGMRRPSCFPRPCVRGVPARYSASK